MVKVHAIYNAQRYEIPVEPPATVAEVADEIGRHFALLKWTFAVEYLHGQLWVGAPGPTTIGELLERQGPLQLTSRTGQLLGAAPREALELRVHPFPLPVDEVSVVTLARVRARLQAEGRALFARHAVGRECERRLPPTSCDQGDSDWCEPPRC